MSIYLHGYTHTQYDKETPERLLSDTNKAQEDLENNLEDNNILKVFTYPYGLYTFPWQCRFCIGFTSDGSFAASFCGER